MRPLWFNSVTSALSINQNDREIQLVSHPSQPSLTHAVRPLSTTYLFSRRIWTTSVPWSSFVLEQARCKGVLRSLSTTFTEAPAAHSNRIFSTYHQRNQHNPHHLSKPDASLIQCLYRVSIDERQPVYAPVLIVRPCEVPYARIAPRWHQ